MTTTSAAPATGWTGVERRAPRKVDTTGIHVKRVGEAVFRYGLALVFIWQGLLNFTQYNAAAFQNMLAGSPFTEWLYLSLGLQHTANMAGVINLSIGVLLACRSFWPSLSIIGSMGAVITCIITLSFMLTTGGIWQAGYAFPALSVFPGQFLLKDLVLLGVSIWTLGEATRADRLT